MVEGRKTFGNTITYIKMTASSNFENVFSVLLASAFLPFLPIQLLTINLLYDLSQTSIPWDDMDPDYLTVPRKWRADDIGRFMLFIGPTSSVFDIATFAIMWFVFGARTPAHQSLLQSGWFIESLFTQTLIVPMIRTAKIPFLPLGHRLGLQALPGSYFLWLLAIMFSSIGLVQVMKQWYIRRLGVWL